MQSNYGRQQEDSAASASPTHLMNLIESLENTKRQAAANYASMGANPSPQGIALTTRSELDVLCARVDVLNTLLRQPPDAKPLCLESTASTTGITMAAVASLKAKKPRLCVIYDRLRCDGDLELGPMQSTMAWAVRDAEDAFTQLVTAPDSHSPAQTVQGLLDLVRKSAPKKDILQSLQAVLSLPPPERLVLKSVQGINAQDFHARVFEGMSDNNNGDGSLKDSKSALPPPLYRVIWGALSLDVLEGWQNPSTNTAIRLSILNTAHQAARDAQQTKALTWSNVAHLQVHIYHGEESHRLSFQPFWDSESCTVSHIQFAQSVFDDSGPERGLLNLSQDPSTIHPIPMGRILPMQAYVCLGAHRKSRLSEAQLNYVHAQGLKAHGFDPALLPDPSRLRNVQPGRMPPAKATRVSGDKLDVMASSYHIADQVYTTITVVQYPPFGTQFERLQQKKDVQMAGPLGRMMVGVIIPPAYQKPEQPSQPSLPAPPPPSEPTHENESDDESVEDDMSRQYPVHERDVNEDCPIPLYKRERKYKPAIANRKMEKFQYWDVDLDEGQHFFVDGIFGNSTDINQRFIWFEMDNGTRYKEAEKLGTILRDYFKTNFPGDRWLRNKCFYYNIDNNKNKGLDGYTAKEIWSHHWKQFITDKIYKYNRKNMLGKKTVGAAFIESFWYTPTSELWYQLLDQGRAENSHSSLYKFKSEQLYQHHKEYDNIESRFSSRSTPLAMKQTTKTFQTYQTANQQIPLPPPRTTMNASQTVAKVGQLQERISALESRLGRIKQDENTQHLLAKVLDKLELAVVD